MLVLVTLALEEVLNIVRSQSMVLGHRNTKREFKY